MLTIPTVFRGWDSQRIDFHVSALQTPMVGCSDLHHGPCPRILVVFDFLMTRDGPHWTRGHDQPAPGDDSPPMPVVTKEQPLPNADVEGDLSRAVQLLSKDINILTEILSIISLLLTRTLTLTFLWAGSRTRNHFIEWVEWKILRHKCLPINPSSTLCCNTTQMIRNFWMYHRTDPSLWDQFATTIIWSPQARIPPWWGRDFLP